MSLMSSDSTLSFRINEYLTLKWEDGAARIYIGGKKFELYCKPLIISVDIDHDHFDGHSLEDIERSIKDNFSNEGLDKEEYDNEILKSVSVEEIFWGHCSNLQAWADDNYNTEIIHVNLAFPLLNKLKMAGDPVAKHVYKKELIKKITSYNETVATYVLAQGWLADLTVEETTMYFDELKARDFKFSEAQALIIICNKINQMDDPEYLKRGIKYALKILRGNELEAHPSAIAFLIKFHEKDGKFKEAKKYVEEAMEHHEDDRLAMMACGSYFRATGKFDNAKYCYEKSLERDPLYIPSLIPLAKILIREGRIEEATARLEAAIPQHQDNEFLWAALSEAYHAQKDFHRTLDALKVVQSIGNDEDNLDFHKSLIITYTSLDKYQEAVDHAYKIMEKFGADNIPLDILLAASSSLSYLDRYDESVDMYKRIIGMGLEGEDSVTVMIDLALIYEHVGREDDALELYKESLIQTNQIDTFLWVTGIHLEHGRMKMARATLETAAHMSLDVSIDWLDRHYNRWIDVADDFHKASWCVKRILRLDPDYPNAWSKLAFTLIHMEQYDKAISCVAPSLNHDSKASHYESSWYNLITWFLEHGDRTHAEKVCRIVLDARPDASQIIMAKKAHSLEWKLRVNMEDGEVTKTDFVL